jgi:hypothetical protein
MKSMIPLGLFLLGCAAIYVGTIQAAFSALMRLSLRINAERTGVTPVLERYLREPMTLFVPARLLLAIILLLVSGLIALLIDVGSLHGFGLLVLGAGGFAIVCEQLVPLLIARTNAQTVLQLLLPSFRVVASPLLPLTLALVGLTPREPATGNANTTPRSPPAGRRRRGSSPKRPRPVRTGTPMTHASGTPKASKKNRTARNSACCSRSSTSATSWSAR